MIRSILAAAALCLSASIAQSAPVDPVFTRFGSLPGATFGGNGIPTDPVAVTSFTTAGGSNVTLAMSATQRFFNPALTNDVNGGTYFAGGGVNTGGPGSSSTTVGALWNFNFYASVDSGSETLVDLGLQLLYDFYPGLDTDEAAHGVLLSAALPFLGTVSGETLQGSQNLNFGFLGTSVPGGIVAPGGSYNPNAGGEYSFALVATGVTDGNSAERRAAINVVVSPVPLPAGAWLMLGGLGGLTLLRRRQRAQS